MVSFIMLFQGVFAEVIRGVAPDCVDVIGVILSVVVFDEERRTLDAVIVPNAHFGAARPRERDLVKTGDMNAAESKATVEGPIDRPL